MLSSLSPITTASVTALGYNQNNTGDGIKMVQNVGAQLWHMNNIIGSYNAYFKDFEWPYASRSRRARTTT